MDQNVNKQAGGKYSQGEELYGAASKRHLEDFQGNSLGTYHVADGPRENRNGSGSESLGAWLCHNGRRDSRSSQNTSGKAERGDNEAFGTPVSFEHHTEELEHVVVKLKRDLLLPCGMCQKKRNVSNAEMESWEALSDSVLLLESVWEQFKAADFPEMDEVLDNGVTLDGVRKSNLLVEELEEEVSKCITVEKAAAEAESSLFSLFPFSAGMLSSIANVEKVKERKDREEKRISTVISQGSGKSMDREGAVKAARRLMMDMMSEILRLRAETNGYISALAQRDKEKDDLLKRVLRGELEHESIARIQTSMSMEGSTSSRASVSDDFLNEPELEVDAAEVEL